MINQPLLFSPFPGHSQILVSTIISSTSMRAMFAGYTCQWDFIILPFYVPSLFYLTQQSLFLLVLCWIAGFHTLLWLNYIYCFHKYMNSWVWVVLFLGSWGFLAAITWECKCFSHLTSFVYKYTCKWGYSITVALFLNFEEPP